MLNMKGQNAILFVRCTDGLHTVGRMTDGCAYAGRSGWMALTLDCILDNLY